MPEDKEFDIDWPHGHMTRSGDPVRIICKDLDDPEYKIVVHLQGQGCSYPCIRTYTLKGKAYANSSKKHPDDLVNSPAPLNLKVGDLVVREDGRVGFVVKKKRNMSHFGIVFKGSTLDYTYRADGSSCHCGSRRNISRVIDVEV